MNIPVEDITRDKIVLKKICEACMTHGDCKVELKDDCLIFPENCKDDCRTRTINHMMSVFLG